MSTSAKQLESEAMKLPREERAELADKLWLSLEDQTAVESAWSDEIERRLREVDEGIAQTISHEDVVAEMRARYSK
jgi:putative addiction module component (TIGR02574 family)